MTKALQVSLLFLQALHLHLHLHLHLVHCSTGSVSVRTPSLFGIRTEASDKLRHSSASSSNVLQRLPQLLVRGGSKGKHFDTWSDQIHQPLKQQEFSVIKPGDGSEEDTDGIPKRYLIAHKDNREKAKAAFEKTLAWRIEKQVDIILIEPPSNFDLCHQIFPVYLPGRDAEGHLILVQRPGKVRLDLATNDDKSATEEMVLQHYLYIVEYVWNLLDPSPMPPNGLMTSIIDCTGVKLDMVYNKQFRSFGKKLVAIMSNHYPTRSHKTLIINAPKWIKLAFNLVKPLMRESTRKKVMILNSGKYQDKILQELLGGFGEEGDGDSHLPFYLSSKKDQTEEDEDEDEEELSEIEKELRIVAHVGLHPTKSSAAEWATA